MKKLILPVTLLSGLFAQTTYYPNNGYYNKGYYGYYNKGYQTTKTAPQTTNKIISNITIKTPPIKQGTIYQGYKTATISQTPGLIKRNIIKVEANGIGVAPDSSISPAQAMAMARRAAIIDGYKALTEKLYGIKVNGRDTVKDMVLRNSTIRSEVAGVIRGAKVIDEEYKNGMYKVVMTLKLNVANWNRYLRKNPPYSY